METTTVFKMSVLSAFIVLMTACSDPDDVYTGGVSGNEVGAPENTSTPEPSGSNEGNTRPQFVTSDCGSLPISDDLPGNVRSAPTILTTEQLVSGRIAPESERNYEHFWRISLEPGSYNIVFDAETVAGDYKYLNTRMTDLKGLDSEDDELLIRFAESNYRARYHEFIEIEEPRTMDLIVTADDRAQDYRFGIFENGNPVPSPFFNDCPSIKPLSLDTTEALIFPEQTSSDQDLWYLVNLEAKDYVMSSRASTTDCEDGGIEYEISHVDQFGQKSRMEDHDRITLEGASVTGSTSMKSLELGPVWIRIQNHDCALSLEFTLNAES